MRLRVLSRFFAVGLCLWAAIARAGTVTPGLADAFDLVGDQEKLPVLISLANQVDLAGVEERWFRGAEMPFAERHDRLRDTLEAASRISQDAVRASFAILERNGMVSDVQPLWLSNMLTANVSRAGAELIANFETVLEVGLDEQIRLLEPTSTKSSEPKLLATDAALKTMRAPEAWSRDITGAGATVAAVGMPFTHSLPALTGRMSGETSPAECNDAAALMLGCALGVDAEKGDTVGVAPQAQWRLLPLVCGQTARVSDVIRQLEVSQKAGFADAPDVIVQAWEIGDSCSSGLPEAAWRAFANVEQLGSILIWAAGDHGTEGRGSIHLPAAKVSEQLTFFSVGTVSATSGALELDERSSRGPSPCDFKNIKPDISAIGVSVRSAGKDDFALASGSLCAAGYVAGTCALMRQVNPEITASAAKIALQLSAHDLGVTGEDNEFGYGLLDIAAAVELAASSSKTGTVIGIVRYGGEQIAGARAFLISATGSYTAVTNGEGKFRFGQVPADQPFALYLARFGYKDFAAPESVRVAQRAELSVSVELERGLADDAEVDRGFILGVTGDDATSGLWTRAIPEGSSEKGKSVQVSEDATAYGSFCFVTGNGASTTETAATHDVDGGKTTLRTPLFRLDNISDPKLKFSYAYSNDRGPQKGGDFFRVQVSNDTGETWINLIQTSVSTDGWQEVQFALDDFVAPTSQMLLQFVAEDNAPPSLVEAAVDDIFIEGRADAPEPPKNLALTPSDTGVQLTWNSSVGASSYKVYMAGEPGHVFAPENYLTTVPDTFMFVPFDQIPYERFYFQVTAVK